MANPVSNSNFSYHPNSSLPQSAVNNRYVHLNNSTMVSLSLILNNPSNEETQQLVKTLQFSNLSKDEAVKEKEGGQINAHNNLNTAPQIVERLKQASPQPDITNSNSPHQTHKNQWGYDVHNDDPPSQQTISLQKTISLKQMHPHFVGRTEELSCIEAQLNKHHQLVLFGPGGMGKTELAITFANRHVDRYSLIWSIPSATLEERLSAYRKLADAISVPLTQHDKPEDVFYKVHHRLEQNRQTPWLLIYDDFNPSSSNSNSNDVFELPQRGGDIIFTSYSKTPEMLSLEVKPFSPSNAIELVCQETQEAHSPAMDQLIELCGCYPILLGRIATHISRIPGSTIAGYLAELSFQDLLRLKPEQRYQKTFEEAVRKTFKALPPKVQAWLKVCTYFHPLSIPITYLEAWITTTFKDDQQSLSFSRNEILIALSEHAMQERSEDRLMMHRLLHQTLSTFEEGEHLSSAVDLLLKQAEAWDFEKADGKRVMERASNWSEHASLLIHHRRWSHISEEQQAKLFFHLGDQRTQACQFAEALKTHQQALAIRQKGLGEGHPDVASSLNRIATCYHSQGELAEALKLYQQALAIRQKVLGEDHLDVAMSLNNIANCYRSKGEFAEALKTHQQALAIRQKVLGEDHPDVATSLNNIANCYHSQGKFAKALKLYQQALVIRQKVLGEGHPDVAKSLNNIANCYYSQRKFAKALKTHQQALVIRQKVLGEDHLDVAMSLNNIANCYYSQEQFAEALKTHQQALAIRQKVLGERHPDVAMSLNNIASCYEFQGEFAEALRLYQQAYEIAKKSLGEKHPDTQLYLRNLQRISNVFSLKV